MREEPSAELIELLDRLGLATLQQVRAVRRRGQRLARGLPLFESVWVDALVQRRVLTPLQAARINAGRGRELVVGPYVLTSAVSNSGYGRCYAAREIETRRPVWLLLAAAETDAVAEAQRALQQLVELAPRLASDAIVPVHAAALQPDRVWAASAPVTGRDAADWMVRNGRLPPAAVLAIAQQMASALAALERHDVVHGDISATALILNDSGRAKLVFPGLRGIVRPAEGYARTRLAPEAYDYLAPERVTDGTRPTTQSDLYASGLLWWHLLTGRAPLAGGNSLAKLTAAQEAKIPDVRDLAPETPALLANAVRACTERPPGRRPASFAALAQTLGDPTRAGNQALAGALAGHRSVRLRPAPSGRNLVRPHPAFGPLVALAGSLIVLAGLTWPLWYDRVVSPPGLARRYPQGGSEASAAPHRQRRRAAVADQQASAQARLQPGAVADRAVAAAPARSTAIARPPDLVLPTGRDARLDGGALRTGQTVRGPAGDRARVVVAEMGLVVGVEDVVFQNIDFVGVAGPGSNPRGGRPRAGALIDLRVERAAFVACSFQTPSAVGAGRVAIACRGPVRPPQRDRLPAPVVLRLIDCALRRVAAGVDACGSVSLSLDIRNTLHLGPGPLLRLRSAAHLEESIHIALARCTVRAVESLIDIRLAPTAGGPGPLAIEAVDCVFAPAAGGPLLRLIGPQAPRQLLRMTDWSGQGSLLDHGGRFAVWIDGDGRSHAVDDSAVRIHGLVGSRIRFAGRPQAGPAASHILRWSAPLKSAAPPGIRAASLALPTLD